MIKMFTGPIKEPKIALLQPDMPNAEQLLPWLQRIDAERWYTNFGPLVQLLEQSLMEWLEQNSPASQKALHVCTTSTGTSALALAFNALDLPKGSRVLLPAFTFPATGLVLLRAGLKPVFTDVSADNWLLTPAIARQACQHMQIDAVLPVATFGCPQDVAAWDHFVLDSQIPVVIDAAAAMGQQGVGEHSLVAFSMHATKAFGIGEGGLLAARQPELMSKVRRLSNFGFNQGYTAEAGTNAKLSEYHAAVGLAQLERWPQLRQQRQRVWQEYERTLQSFKLFEQLGRQAALGSYVNSLLPLLMPNRIEDVLSLQVALAEQGIETRRWYCPTLTQQPVFAGETCLNPQTGADDLPMTSILSKQLLGIPFHTYLTSQQITWICEQLQQALSK